MGVYWTPAVCPALYLVLEVLWWQIGMSLSLLSEL